MTKNNILVFKITNIKECLLCMVISLHSQENLEVISFLFNLVPKGAITDFGLHNLLNLVLLVAVYYYRRWR